MVHDGTHIEIQSNFMVWIFTSQLFFRFCRIIPGKLRVNYPVHMLCLIAVCDSTEKSRFKQSIKTRTITKNSKHLYALKFGSLIETDFVAKVTKMVLFYAYKPF